MTLVPPTGLPSSRRTPFRAFQPALQPRRVRRPLIRRRAQPSLLRLVLTARRCHNWIGVRSAALSRRHPPRAGPLSARHRRQRAYHFSAETMSRLCLASLLAVPVRPGPLLFAQKAPPPTSWLVDTPVDIPYTIYNAGDAPAADISIADKYPSDSFLLHTETEHQFKALPPSKLMALRLPRSRPTPSGRRTRFGRQ